MKRKKTVRADLFAFCSDVSERDPAEAQPAHAGRSGGQRKALQLCAQAAQALGYALSWETNDDVIAGLLVESVVPAPNSTHLLVTVTAPSEVPVDEVLNRLPGHIGRLRAEVARSIHRKRVPELSFRVVKR